MYEWYLAFSESKKNIWQNYFEEEDTVQSYGKCQGLNIKLESTTAGRIRRGSSTFGNLFSSSFLLIQFCSSFSYRLNHTLIVTEIGQVRKI